MPKKHLEVKYFALHLLVYYHTNTLTNDRDKTFKFWIRAQAVAF
jgi:hypothetical protein